MDIQELEHFFEKKLPKAYVVFLDETNGGTFGDILVYSKDDVIERNECYETKEYAPGWIAIGDDGGG
ncbi:MAG: SMI1/KNR4 family protein, partial [Pseudomonadales bacterium]|nr:SMI1/KNR4 family protein [Pseudomonadales bacterium]